MLSRPFLDPSIQVPAGLPHDLAASFAAHRYQHWIHRAIQPHLGRRILEVGAGCGAMTRWFQGADLVLASEPDPQLVGVLKGLLPQWFPAGVRAEARQLALPQDGVESLQGLGIDTVVSFNVLEHIEDDGRALEQLAWLLRQSGPGPRRLISFVPAHPFAYGAHDRYTGHYRRYTRQRLRQLAERAAPGAPHTIRSFNFFGLWAWWLKGRVLGDSRVDARTIASFERVQPLLEPLDRVLLGGLRLPFGQSLLSVIEVQA